jgi:hypothetical protein
MLFKDNYHQQRGWEKAEEKAKVAEEAKEAEVEKEEIECLMTTRMIKIRTMMTT